MTRGENGETVSMTRTPRPGCEDTWSEPWTPASPSASSDRRASYSDWVPGTNP